ncbi:thioredoxin domain-containing protein [Alkalihalobacillus sp. AL-G]|uniref:DsbA family protein n=1 Tax=Alkalihalobacillus sp. AL-G TaxID=2926399 RepID=UPI00272B1EF1|nr:thioredoxin domain-containing protein [Alkalihalobacillus sp. AL-G]WLD94200.1 DsbA family protein [Alkalihalobacillus sp. AL-G]
MANKKKKKNQTVYKPPKNSNKGFILIISGIFILAAILLFFVSNQEPKGDATGNTDIEVSYEGQPSIGEEDAPVKILEFADFKCPGCAHFAAEIYPQIQKDFIDTGKVEMFMVNKPFVGPDSTTAAIVGEAVLAQDEQAYWEYYELVFSNQGKEQEQWATEEFLIGLIDENIEGINIEQLKSDIDAGKFEDEIKEDITMSNEVQSTPTIVINGKQIQDPFDYEGTIKPAIEDAIADNNE